MRLSNRILCLVFFGFAVPLTGQVASATELQSDVAYSPSDIRQLAIQALIQGDAQTAFDLTSALLVRDPSDVDALLLRSRAARNLGDAKTAKSAARDAWKAADTDRTRYAAALANAQALSSDGARTRAQWWLRRAIQIAPNDDLKAKAARDFQYVRGQNPWSTQLSFTASPSSNVNGGSSSETVSIYDLPFDFVLQGTSRALSGIEYSFGFSTRYDLKKSAKSRTSLSFAASHKTYSLSEDAKKIAPDAKGSDFALTQVSTGLSQDWVAPSGRFALNGQLGLNKVWYGGEPLSQSVTLTGGARYAFTQNLSTNLSATHEWQEGLGGRGDADVLRGTLSTTYKLPTGDGLKLSLGQTTSTSSAAYLDYDETSASLTYALAKPIWGTRLQLGLDGRHRHFDETTVSFGDRDDFTYGAQATVTLDSFDYYGFVPTVTVRAEETDSNLAIYDKDSVDIRIGLKSRF